VTHSRKRINELLDAHGLHPSRALGQNFVADANTVRRIARLADVGVGDHVVEIGGGLGSLTLALVETGARVTVVEIDKHMLPVLREVVAGHHVTVVEGDALKVDWNTIVSPDERAVVVANLPYNVGSSIVATLLDEVPQIERMLVMVQKEVAERLAAGVGDPAYGALSVKIRYHADAKLVGDVPSTVFVPKPDVVSALVDIRRLPSPRVDVDRDRLFELVRAGFAQRRKMLRGSLKGRVSAEQFACAAIEPTARAEELDVEDWGRLVQCLI
jgi:16S rRNA (adenine1518-N6/adenine1519-N6)-dimethyltransferase